MQRHGVRISTSAVSVASFSRFAFDRKPAKTVGTDTPAAVATSATDTAV